MKAHQIGDYEVRHKEAENHLREMGRTLRDSCPPGHGFAYFLFTYGEGGNFFYTASCERGDMIKLLEEFITKLKGDA